MMSGSERHGATRGLRQWNATDRRVIVSTSSSLKNALHVTTLLL
jgi:hypothetical protein